MRNFKHIPDLYVSSHVSALETQCSVWVMRKIYQHNSKTMHTTHLEIKKHYRNHYLRENTTVEQICRVPRNVPWKYIASGIFALSAVYVQLIAYCILQFIHPQLFYGIWMSRRYPLENVQLVFHFHKKCVRIISKLWFRQSCKQS